MDSSEDIKVQTKPQSTYGSDDNEKELIYSRATCKALITHPASCIAITARRATACLSCCLASSSLYV
jgi:hypothetical protein